jgi:hypothetical protein
MRSGGWFVTAAAEKDLVRRRLGAQLLSGRPASSPEAVVQRILAVQAQDGRGARLAVRSRTRGAGLHAGHVDAALSERRSLVITWLNRGTLQLVGADDYWWLHPLTTPQIAATNRTRLHQEGVSDRQATRGVEAVVEALRSHGVQTRAELRKRLDAAHVPTKGQALVHVLLAASLRSDVVRGPMRGSEHAFVSASDWLGDPPEPLERADALAHLARRYLDGHAPADARDLARWAGVTLRDARAAFDGIADELVARADGLVDLADRGAAPPALPKPRLLGPFDPLLHGWVSRASIIGLHRGIVTTNGLFRPFALVDGRAVATWGLSGSTLTVKPLEPLKPAVVTALRADAADVLRFLDRTDCEIVVEARST